MAFMIDANLSYIKNRLNITSSRAAEYANMSIDEIIEAEKDQGNSNVDLLTKEILSSPDKLLEALQLAEPFNKLNILSKLNEKQLEDLLPLLEKEDLVIGLNFFTKEKLLELTGKIPMEQLVDVVLENFPPEKLMKLFKDEDFNMLFANKDLDKELVFKHLQGLPPEVLAQMLEAVTGMPVNNMDPAILSKQICMLDDEEYLLALTSMKQEMKMLFTYNMLEDDKKVYELFNPESFVGVMEYQQKPELVKSMHVVKDENLINIIRELPRELLAIVLTQIDPNVFAEVLVEKYQGLLATLTLS